MNPLERLEIHLEDSREGTYLTGQKVPGKLVMTLRRSLKIQGIEIKVRGRGHAQWNEGEGEIEQLLFETEDYIKQSIIVLGKAPDKNSHLHIEFLDSGQNTFHFNFTIPDNIPSSFEAPDKNSHPHIEFLDSGQNTFHFNFNIPENIPSSFEDVSKYVTIWKGVNSFSAKGNIAVFANNADSGLHGYIRYWVKAKIYGVWGLLDQSGKVEFGVQRSLDLNTVPGAMEPAEDEDSCILCGCCLNNGYIQALLRINKRGFIPGESIICNAEIYNGSDTSLKSTKVKFYRVVTYGDTPFESNTIEKKTMSERKRGKIKPGRSEVYQDETLTLPPFLPVTSLPGCSFIEVDYVVELKVSSQIDEYNLRIPLLIIVGTIPFDGTKDNDSAEGLAGSGELFVPDIYQPFLNDPVIADAGKRITTPTISVAPIGTELQALYPPMRNLSILEREKTLNEIYRKRRRAVRFMGVINEGADFEDDELYQETEDHNSRASNNVSVDLLKENQVIRMDGHTSISDIGDTSV